MSRIQIVLNNKTAQTKADSGNGVGAVAVRSTRGTSLPTYFSPGQTQRLIEMCGDPGPLYPDLLEALEYVQSYGLWVSCPSLNGRYGGVAVTPTGTKKLPGGFSAIPAAGLTQVTLFETLGIGDGTTTAFGKTLLGGATGMAADYVNLSVRIVEAGTVLTGQSVSDAATEAITATAGTGTYVRVTGVLSFNFTTAPTAGARIEASYTLNLSALGAYALLISRAPQADYLTVKNTMATDHMFTSALFGYDSSGAAVSKETKSWSLVQGTLDKFGQSAFISDVFNKDDWVVPYLVSAVTTPTFSGDATTIDFGGGSRGDAISGSDLATALQAFTQARTYPADVFFDATALPEVATQFAALRTNNQKYSKYILPTPYATDPTAAQTYTPTVSDRGIKLFWNWGLVTNTWNNNGSAWTPLTGEVAKNHADVIVGAFGGMAVSWINENGWGGQLTSGRVLEMLYDPDETTTDAITANGLNPIIRDPSYGTMILSEVTTDRSNSDYSYGSYSGTLDYIIKNIVNNVLPYQIEKFNDDAHRLKVKTRCDRLLSGLQVPPRNVLYAFATKCDATNNTVDVMNMEQFKLDVAIQVTRMSRTIIATFISSPTGTDINLAFA